MRWLELKVPPVIVVAAFACAMLAATRLIPAANIELLGSQIAALSLVLLGLIIVLAGVCAFRANKTTVDPRTPNATSTIVVDGVYRLSRNPMYLGFLCMLAGFSIYLSNVAASMLLPAFVVYLNVFQIEPEERILLSRFGPQFAEYMASVRRWV